MSAVEVITRVERRRRWSSEEKQRLVAESVNTPEYQRWSYSLRLLV
jgi:transposase-like protein